jgi:hypothetical protein
VWDGGRAFNAVEISAVYSGLNALAGQKIAAAALFRVRTALQPKTIGGVRKNKIVGSEH